MGEFLHRSRARPQVSEHCGLKSNSSDKSKDVVPLEEKKTLDFKINRLRASHAGFVFYEVLRKITIADILFFDVADVSEVLDKNGTINDDRKFDISGKKLKPNHKGEWYLKYESFNANVLIEFGMALR